MKLVWDKIGEKLYETGVEQVALYQQDNKGAYPKGVAWNGFTGLTLSPSGAEPTALYANDRKYLTMMSAEELGGTLAAYTYPKEWGECDGSAEVTPGVFIGQQTRKVFGLVAKTLVGNDTEQTKFGYKLHIIYGGLATPSEKEYTSVNDSPEATEFSWEFSTTPVEVTDHDPTSYICIESKNVDAEKLAALEAVLYGSDGEGADARLPLPDEVFAILNGTAA